MNLQDLGLIAQQASRIKLHADVAWEIAGEMAKLQKPDPVLEKRMDWTQTEIFAQMEKGTVKVGAMVVFREVA